MQTLVIDYLYGVIWTYKVAHIEGMDRVWPRFDYIGYSVTVTYAWLACSGSPAAGSKKKKIIFCRGYSWTDSRARHPECCIWVHNDAYTSSIGPYLSNEPSYMPVSFVTADWLAGQ